MHMKKRKIKKHKRSLVKIEFFFSFCFYNSLYQTKILQIMKKKSLKKELHTWRVCFVLFSSFMNFFFLSNKSSKISNTERFQHLIPRKFCRDLFRVINFIDSFFFLLIFFKIVATAKMLHKETMKKKFRSPRS